MYLKQFPLKRPWLLITGVVLGAILIGVVLMISRPLPMAVQVEGVQIAPERYLDTFVEIQGNFGMIGLDDCSGLGHGLISLTTPGRYLLVDVSSALVDPKRVGRALIQGWVRKDSTGLCGAHSPLYIEAVKLDFLESSSP
jgi:hypothetical protein